MDMHKAQNHGASESLKDKKASSGINKQVLCDHVWHISQTILSSFPTSILQIGQLGSKSHIGKQIVGNHPNTHVRYVQELEAH